MDAFDNPARNGTAGLQRDGTSAEQSNGAVAGSDLLTAAANVTATASAMPLAIQGILVPDASGRIVLPAGASIDDITVSGTDLIVTLPGGQVLIIPNGAVDVPAIVIDGDTVPASTVAQLLEDLGDFNPEAGARSSGGNFADPEGPIQDAYALGDLLPYTELAFPQREDRELLPDVPDEEPEVVIATPDQPAGATAATASVDEAGLPARAGEPAGSDSAATSESTSGTIVFDAADGLDSITINGSAITAVGQVITTPLGQLTITSLAPGSVGYSYTLADNTDANANLTDVFNVVITDRDGDTATATLTIDVVDDVPTARNDSDTVAGGTRGPETGNVLTGAGTTSGTAGADTPGADGATLTGIRSGSGDSFSAPGTVQGQYGTLTINADGSYSYVRNPGTPGGVDDVFTYRITDSDGDTSTATLTIAIESTPPPPPPPPVFATVDEAGLAAREGEPAGSNSGADSETTTGTIPFFSFDGVASVTLAGTVITPDSLPQTVFSDAAGTLVVTSYSYDPVTGQGSVGYSYTLTDNTSGDDTEFEFLLEVTDLGDGGSERSLIIDVIDDVPTARADTDAVAAGSFAPETGNVLTGVGTTSGTAGSDTQGADGATLTGVRPAGSEGGFAEPGVVAGQYGTLTLNADGSYSYVRSPGTPGGVDDVFTYQITDGDGDISTATLTISIADSPTVITFVPGDGEGDGGTIVYEADLPGRDGETPGSAFGGGEGGGASTSGTITFTAIDGVGSVSLGGTVIAPGSLPQTVSSDATGTLVVTGYSYDPVTGEGSVTYVYTLIDNTLDDDGTTVSFDLVITDADGDAASDTLDIQIVDDAPTARADTDSVTEDGPLTADGNVLSGSGGSDANGSDGVADVQGADGASVTAVAGGAIGEPLAGAYGMLTLNSDGSYSYVLNNGAQPVQGLAAGETLTDIFTYTITDGDGDTSTTTLTITINGADDGVTITGLDAEGAELTVDEDDLADGSSPDAAALTQDGSFTISTPDGLANVTIGGVAVVTNGVFAPATVTSPLGTVNVTGFTPVTGADGSVIGGSFTYEYVLADNTLTHGSGGQDSVTDSFAVVVTDGDGSSANASLDVRIIDDVPTARDDADSVTEDGPLTADGNVLTGLGGGDANATDGVADTQGADGAAVTAVAGGAIGEPLAGAYGTLTLNSDGSYTYVLDNGAQPVQGLAPGETLTESFAYTITDGDGDLSSATLTITINGADDGVTIEGLDVQGGEVVVDEDDLADGSSPDAAALTQPGSFTISTPDGLGDVTIGGVQVVTNGVFTAGSATSALGTINITGFTPVTGADGSVIGGTFAYEYVLADNTLTHPNAGEDFVGDSFAVVVTDSDGSAANASLDVRIIDDVPTAADDSASAAEDMAVTIDVLTNDVRGADGVDPATGVALATAPAKGNVVYNGDGTFTYTPTPGQEGEDSFTYTITDGDGDTSTATVTVTLAADSTPTLSLGADNEVDEAGLPAGSDAASNSETATGSFTLTTGNDSVASLVINGVDVTAGGTVTTPFGVLTVTESAGAYSYSYTLTTNTSGDDTFDSFAAVLTDSDGDTATDTLVIDIIDDVPTARPDADSVTEDGPLTADGNVLTGSGGGDANATDGILDTQGADGASVTAVSFGAIAGSVGASLAGAYGTLTLNSDGSYTYVLNNAAQPVQGLSAGDTLTEIFTYTITDGDGDPSTTTLTITIDGADDGVTITGLDAEGAELFVDEDDLPARAGEAPGSDTSPDGVTDGDSFSVSTPDGMGSVVLDSFNGVPLGAPLTLVTAGGSFTPQSVVTAYGTLSVTGFTPVTGTDGSVIGGTFTYSYTLADNRTDHPAAGQDDRTDSIGVTVTDIDGSSASDAIDIRITDDVPDAIDDGTTQALENAPVTIDVLANDVQGADSVQPGAVELVAGSLTGAGSLVNNGDGSFTYTPAAQETGTVSFQYRVTDGDGDTDIATATITLVADSAPQIRNADDVTVDEDGLSGANIDNGLAGEVTSTGSASATGTISVDFGSDVPATLAGSLVLNDSAALDTQLTVNNVAVTFAKDGDDLVGSVGGDEVIRISLTTATAGPGATEVTYGYSVTLAQAIDQAVPGSEDSDFLSGIGFTVTDNDGTPASGSFDVTIVDDLPTLSVSDTPTSVVEGATVGGSWTLDEGADGVTSILVSFGSGSATLALTPGNSVSITQPTGTLTVNSDGSFSFAAANDQNDATNPSATFTLSAVDRDGDPTQDSLTIAIEDGANPVNAAPITLTVNEAAIDAIGTDPASGDEIDSGNLSFTAGSDTLSGFAFTGVAGLATNLDGAGPDIFWSMAPDGQTISGSLTMGGPAAITISLTAPASIAPGATANASVTVTLADNLPHELAMAAQTQSLGTVTVQASDTDGDLATGVVTVQVTDDIPVAAPDADSVTEDGALIADGNVLTGSGGGDANATDGVADEPGADGASVTALAGGTVGVPLVSTYGTLTLNADGSYSYALDNANSAVQGLSAGQVLTEIFTYTITDGDGDPSTTTLTITINGANDGVTINGLAVPGGEETVDEDDLADGSSPDAAALTQPGSFTVDAPDGLNNVTIGTAQVMMNGVFTPGLTTISALGTLTITGFTPVLAADNSVIGGTFTYEYVLDDNTLTHPAAGEDNVTDSFAVTVTDSDGSIANADLDIKVIDDVPTASAEPNQNVAEGATVAGTLDFVEGADGASVTAINGTALVFGMDGFSQAIDIGDGTIMVKADGSYSFTAAASVAGTGSASATYTVTDGDNDVSSAPISFTIVDANTPTAGATQASVDDDALLGGNPASMTGDLPDPNSDGDNDQATFSGLLNLDFGGDGPGSVSFAAMDGDTAMVGTEEVTYDWNAGSNTLTATGPRGVLFTVEVTNPATGAYTVTLLDNVLHASGGDENDASTTLDFLVSDSDGSTAPGTLTITFDDDAPTAVDDSDTIAAGTFGPATGNVITDAAPGDAGDADDGADMPGADGAAVAAVVSVNVPANDDMSADGSGNFQVSGQYGVLTINTDGSYSYTRNAGTPGGVSDAFTYTLRDGDGDTATATLTIGIADATPVTGANLTALLDDDALLGGIAGGTGDDVDAQNVSGTLAGSGGDGGLTYAFQTTGAPLGFTYELSGSNLLVKQGATTVLTVTLNPANGAYSVTQNAPIVHPDGLDENNQSFTLSYTVTDVDGDAAPGTLGINVDDDTPTVTLAAINEVGVVLTTQDAQTIGAAADTAVSTANFGGVFNLTSAYGADGAGTTGLTYALSLVGANGTDSTLDSNGASIFLYTGAGGTIVGSTSASAGGVNAGNTIFTLGVSPAGAVTLTQFAEIDHAPNGDTSAPYDDQFATLANGLVRLTGTATITDADNDVRTSTAFIDLGGNIRFADDGPSITAGTPLPTLTVDESNLGANAVGAAVFTTNFGADGPGTVTYSLGINAGSTGLVDTATGQPVVLTLSGGQVVATAGNGGPTVFTVAVDANGNITLDQIRAIAHDTDGGPGPAHDDAKTLAAANLITLTGTVTDGDGDSAQATINLGQRLTFEDDGPTATADSGTTSEATLDFNAAFVIDFSGSIDNTELNTMLNAVREAGLLLFGSSSGNVSIRIVGFSSTASNLGLFTDPVAFVQAIDSFNPAVGGTRPFNGGTDFTAGIEQLMDVYVPNPNASNQVFFLSDGNPNEQTGSGGNSLANATRADWIDFVNDNDVNVTAIGVGNGIDIERLQDVDVDGEGAPILAADFDDLVQTLLDIVVALPVTGDLDANDSFGADGGRIHSITVDGTTYSWDGANLITRTGANPGSQAGNSMTATTPNGATLSLNFATGIWSYAPPENPTVGSEQFAYTVIDGDGDTAPSTLTVTVAEGGGPGSGNIATADLVITNASGSGAAIPIAEAALLANDQPGATITGSASNVVDAASVVRGGGTFTFTDNDGDGGSFFYSTSPSDSARVTVNRAQAGESTLDGTSASEILVGRDGAADTINGRSGNDYLYGLGGADALVGGDGDDVMDGGAGNDILKGGADDDRLTGGSGNDQFRFATNSGNDIVTDYTDNQDKLAFFDDGDDDGGSVNFGATTGSAGGTALNANDFQTRTSVTNIASGDDDHVVRLTSAQTTAQITSNLGGNNSQDIYVLVFNSTTGKGEIWFDTDWDNTGNRVQIATLDNITSLAQLNQITASDIVVYNNGADPIILDLDGNGYLFDAVATFDINADGAADSVAWNSSGDGILAIDLNGDGRLDSGAELFTPDFAGGGFASGVAALDSLDGNGDGVIDARDAAYADLLVWQDANADGVSDAGEVSRLADLGITSISTRAAAVDEMVDGQTVTARGGFTRYDGTAGGYVEVRLDTQFGTRTAEREGAETQRAAGHQALTSTLVAASLVAMIDTAHPDDPMPAKLAAKALATAEADAIVEAREADAAIAADPLASSAAETSEARDAPEIERSAANHAEEGGAALLDTVDDRAGQSNDRDADGEAGESLFDKVADRGEGHDGTMDGLLALGTHPVPAAIIAANDPAATAVLAEVLDEGNAIDRLIDAVAGGAPIELAHAENPAFDLAQLLEQKVVPDAAFAPPPSTELDLHQVATA